MKRLSITLKILTSKDNFTLVSDSKLAEDAKTTFS